MNNLEKKFYKYLDRQCVADDFKWEELRKNIAYDLAKIANREITKLLKMLEVWEATNEALIKLDKESRAENAALKKQLSEIITKERVKKEIEHEKENLTGVILEIINRCFIDYKSLPKAKDVIGILKGKEGER